MEYSRDTYEQAPPETKDRMMFDMQLETHTIVNDLAKAVAPLKIDVKWLTWGFRLVAGSIAGLAFYILKVIGLK